MIIVLSNTIDSWIKYIWEQFAYINSLKTEYKLIPYFDYEVSSSGRRDTLIIEYADKQRYPESLFIPRRNEFKTDDYIWIKDSLPVYRGSIIEKDGFQDYDILYNAFVHLSRLEEWESEAKGKFIHSYSFNHPRKNKLIWKIPVVNYLFDDLERKIKEIYPEVSFGGKEKPFIEFSHDVDYIKKTAQLRLKQTGFYFYNFIRLLFRFSLKKGIAKLIKGIDFAFSDCDYWCFDQWAELEKKFSIKSVFYFFANLNERSWLSPTRWLIDPSYDILTDERLRDKCKELIDNGNAIGMHGSYLSAQNENLFKKEKEILENCTGIAISKTRQHWLSYYENKTPYIYEKNHVEQDSTIGFNDIAGFRSGIASIYNPYDHKNKRPFSFTEIPMVVMDSHLYDYGDDTHIIDSEWLFNAISNVKNFETSVNWHQRVISNDYKWMNYVKEIAKYSEV